MRKYLDDVAVVVTTFIRPKQLTKCIVSIRKFYPSIKILVADNGRPDAAISAFLRSENCEHLLLPFDSGLAMTRNRGLDKLATYPYVVMLEDDMEFTAESKLEKFKAAIEPNPQIGVVAGGLEVEPGVKNLFANNIVVDKENNRYLVRAIDKPEWHTSGGVRWFYAEYVYNWHIMRNAPDIRWDDDLKQCIEHFDFAVHMKTETKWKIAATPEVVCRHFAVTETKEYVTHRRNYATWKKFFAKRGIRFMHDSTEKRMRDFKTIECLSAPEYHYRMLMAMKEAQSGVDMKDQSLYRDI